MAIDHAELASAVAELLAQNRDAIEQGKASTLRLPERADDVPLSREARPEAPQVDPGGDSSPTQQEPWDADGEWSWFDVLGVFVVERPRRLRVFIAAFGGCGSGTALCWRLVRRGSVSDSESDGVTQEDDRRAPGLGSALMVSRKFTALACP